MVDLLQRARGRGPSRASRAGPIGDNRTLPGDVGADLTDAGLFRMFTPTDLGASEACRCEHPEEACIGEVGDDVVGEGPVGLDLLRSAGEGWPDSTGLLEEVDHGSKLEDTSRISK